MVTTVLVALMLGAGAQTAPVQGPVRDPGRRPVAEPAGTGVIRGRVVAADSGAPVRRANVNLSPVAPPIQLSSAAPPAGGTAGGVLGSVIGGIPSPPPAVVVNGATTTANVQVSQPRPQSVTTDAQGGFEFKDLPAGSYRLMVSPGQYSAAYLGIWYGAKKPTGSGSSDLGTPIVLAEGQRFDKATIALPRGAVITGRVADENGEALARVQVYTLMYQPGSTRGMRTGGNAQTDDLGQFRIYGLAPADYVVAAEARGNTFVPPNAPPETEADRVGFLTTFFPATADEASAQRVRAKAGSETPGVEIHLISGRLFHVTGIVTDSQGRPTPRANGSLQTRQGASIASSFGFSADEQGHFQMRNIPPGVYRLTVRQTQQGPRAPGSPPEPGEFASMPIAVNADVDDILVTTSPGTTITGNVIFENGPPQLTGAQQSFQMRVTAMVGDPENQSGLPPPQPGLVTPDLTFTMKGLSGEMLLRSSGPGNFLKSVMLGGEDIIDTPREFKPGDKVTLVLTSRASTLEGTVADADGKPTTDASIMLFSEDKASWRSTSMRTRRNGTDQAGHYRILGLLPGRYFIVALPRDRMNAIGFGPLDPSVFETLSKDATTVAVGENEVRQVDLKVTVGGQ